MISLLLIDQFSEDDVMMSFIAIPGIEVVLLFEAVFRWRPEAKYVTADSINMVVFVRRCEMSVRRCVSVRAQHFQPKQKHSPQAARFLVASDFLILACHGLLLVFGTPVSLSSPSFYFTILLACLFDTSTINLDTLPSLTTPK
mgnify:CR=1 FL=1